MSIFEVIEEAKKDGFTHVYDGAVTRDIKTFEDSLNKMNDYTYDYALDLRGNVCRLKPDGEDARNICLWFEKH
ncbi:hypothetical protein ACFVS2_20580 [Brevibacillus sp. NPDC058079]|uniref:hypothetical protein n=1 Tax=Brevibacillus sp. NPDC058079 TaxID=3346330 RepID=UPI0036EC7B45